jgi:hypothetical protein
LLRVALNGEDLGITGDVTFTEGFHLYAAMGVEPTLDDPSCGGDLVDPYKFCEIEDPAPGPLHLLLERVAGFGQYQLTVTLFSAPPGSTPRSSPTPTRTPRNTATVGPTRTLGPCVGDCDGDGRIAISELVRGVTLALSGAPPLGCMDLDADDNGAISVNELVSAVNAALNGCVGP